MIENTVFQRLFYTPNSQIIVPLQLQRCYGRTNESVNIFIDTILWYFRWKFYARQSLLYIKLKGVILAVFIGMILTLSAPTFFNIFFQFGGKTWKGIIKITIKQMNWTKINWLILNILRSQFKKIVYLGIFLQMDNFHSIYSRATHSSCSKFFHIFLQFVNKTPDEKYHEASKDTDAEVSDHKRKENPKLNY